MPLTIKELKGFLKKKHRSARYFFFFFFNSLYARSLRCGWKSYFLTSPVRKITKQFLLLYRCCFNAVNDSEPYNNHVIYTTYHEQAVARIFRNRRNTRRNNGMYTLTYNEDHNNDEKPPKGFMHNAIEQLLD